MLVTVVRMKGTFKEANAVKFNITPRFISSAIKIIYLIVFFFSLFIYIYENINVIDYYY